MSNPIMTEAGKVPNLYDFLRGIVEAGPGEPVSKLAIEWCKHYLHRPDTELHFKSYFTGDMKLIEEKLVPAVAEHYIANGHHIDGKPAEPAISYDLGIAGKPVDVFTH